MLFCKQLYKDASQQYRYHGDGGKARDDIGGAQLAFDVLALLFGASGSRCDLPDDNDVGGEAKELFHTDADGEVLAAADLPGGKDPAGKIDAEYGGGEYYDDLEQQGGQVIDGDLSQRGNDSAENGDHHNAGGLGEIQHLRRYNAQQIADRAEQQRPDAVIDAGEGTKAGGDPREEASNTDHHGGGVILLVLFVERNLDGAGLFIYIGVEHCHMLFGILTELYQQVVGFLNAVVGGKGRTDQFLQGVDDSGKRSSDGQTICHSTFGHDLGSDGAAVDNRNGNKNGIQTDERRSAEDGGDGEYHADARHKDGTPFTDELLNITAAAKVEDDHGRRPLGNDGKTSFINNIGGDNAGKEADQEDEHGNHHAGELTLGCNAQHITDEEDAKYNEQIKLHRCEHE